MGSNPTVAKMHQLNAAVVFSYRLKSRSLFDAVLPGHRIALVGGNGFCVAKSFAMLLCPERMYAVARDPHTLKAIDPDDHAEDERSEKRIENTSAANMHALLILSTSRRSSRHTLFFCIFVWM